MLFFPRLLASSLQHPNFPRNRISLEGSRDFYLFFGFRSSSSLSLSFILPLCFFYVSFRLILCLLLSSEFLTCSFLSPSLFSFLFLSLYLRCFLSHFDPCHFLHFSHYTRDLLPSLLVSPECITLSICPLLSCLS